MAHVPAHLTDPRKLGGEGASRPAAPPPSPVRRLNPAPLSPDFPPSLSRLSRAAPPPARSLPRRRYLRRDHARSNLPDI